MFTLSYCPKGYHTYDEISSFDQQPEQWEIFSAVQDLGYGPEGDGKWILRSSEGHTCLKGYARDSVIGVE